MYWMGKLSGGLLGFILFRGSISGALLGVVLGHLFDRGLSGFKLRSSAGGIDRVSGRNRQQIFFETTFLVLGHLAKTDGRVSEEEIHAARNVMHQMQLRPEEIRMAIDLFTRGKSPAFAIDQQVNRLRAVCRSQPLLLRKFVEIQMDMALSKGSIHAAERELLWHIGTQLDMGRVELVQLEAVLIARRRFGSAGMRAETERQELEQAHKALGIEPSSSDREVKTAYRRLMNQHHPDKLVAKGLPDSMLEMAKERTREIRAAYDMIKKNRNIR